MTSQRAPLGITRYAGSAFSRTQIKTYPSWRSPSGVQYEMSASCNPIRLPAASHWSRWLRWRSVTQTRKGITLGVKAVSSVWNRLFNIRSPHNRSHPLNRSVTLKQGYRPLLRFYSHQLWFLSNRTFRNVGYIAFYRSTFAPSWLYASREASDTNTITGSGLAVTVGGRSITVPPPKTEAVGLIPAPPISGY
jgi:hypothetical protein